jgi:UDP:flavonoid glycosyltransferase YjiC (YdhE family)
MLVIPFFGDQLLVGQTIENLGIGKNLVKSRNIDTKKSKSFLNDKLAFKLNKELNKMLHSSKHKQNFKKIDLSTESLDNLLDKI